jgi:hypothetical protein
MKSSNALNCWIPDSNTFPIRYLMFPENHEVRWFTARFDLEDLTSIQTVAVTHEQLRTEVLVQISKVLLRNLTQQK